MKRSYFKFKELDGYIEVFWAQVSNPEETPQFKKIGQVRDCKYYKFRRLYKTKLQSVDNNICKSVDNNIWSQPGEWTPNGWIVKWGK